MPGRLTPYIITCHISSRVTSRVTQVGGAGDSSTGSTDYSLPARCARRGGGEAKRGSSTEPTWHVTWHVTWHMTRCDDTRDTHLRDAPGGVEAEGVDRVDVTVRGREVGDLARARVVAPVPLQAEGAKRSEAKRREAKRSEAKRSDAKRREAKRSEEVERERQKALWRRTTSYDTSHCIT